MIKTKELRLGNTILSWENGLQGKPAPVTLGILKTLSQLKHGMEYLMVKPIQLSPEVLKDAGFEDGLTFGNKKFFFKQLNADTLLCIPEDNLKVCALYQNNQMIYLPYEKYSYLHQLENLFQSMTGEELTVQK
jgi:hypothetical protein